MKNENINAIFDSIDNLDELWKYMKDNINYGWTNKNHEFREYDDSRKKDEYYIHSAIETIKDGYGICMDQVQLEKEYCKFKKIPYTTVSFQFKDDEGRYLNFGHIFLIAYENDKYNYFERAFMPNANIIPFDTLEDAISHAIAYYIMCFEELSEKDVGNMQLYINPEYKVGMNTQDIFETELNTDNKIKEYSKLIIDTMEEIKKSL